MSSSTTARAVFVAEPGPSTDDVRAVAAEVVEAWAPRLATGVRRVVSRVAAGVYDN